MSALCQILALFLAAASARGEMTLDTDQCAYWRYESVELSFFGGDPGWDASQTPVLDAQVRHQGSVVPEPGGNLRVHLRWNPMRQAWVGRWHIPFGPNLGDYTAEVLRPPRRGLQDPEYDGPRSVLLLQLPVTRPALAKAEFSIRGRQPLQLAPGFSAMTLEPGKPGYRHFVAPQGGAPDWRAILDWARFMEADAFWHCAGETQVWKKFKPSEFPWSGDGLMMMPRLAARAHAQGVSYGAYALAFIVLGPKWREAPYTFTTGWDAATGALEPRRFISFDDPARHRDLVDLLRRFQAQKNLDYIGLDYLRTDFGGLEFTEAFLADMDIRPKGLGDTPTAARQRWLGEIITLHKDAHIEELWEWWRAQKVARVVNSLLAEAQVTKPVWVFSLGWQQGHQHGQDPMMLVDAGVSFNSPMFYEVSEKGWPAMLGSWSQYLSASGTAASLVTGQPVDGRLLGEVSGGVGGPELHLRRQMMTLDALESKAPGLGLFWHDIQRASAGGRSGYGQREWSLAGAAAFSRARERGGSLPYTLSVTAAATGEAALGEVVVTNTTPKPLADLDLSPEAAPGVVRFEPAALRVEGLAPGASVRLTFTARLAPDMPVGRSALLALRGRAKGVRRSNVGLTFVTPRPLTGTGSVQVRGGAR